MESDPIDPMSLTPLIVTPLIASSGPWRAVWKAPTHQKRRTEVRPTVGARYALGNKNSSPSHSRQPPKQP